MMRVQGRRVRGNEAARVEGGYGGGTSQYR